MMRPGNGQDGQIAFADQRARQPDSETEDALRDVIALLDALDAPTWEEDDQGNSVELHPVDRLRGWIEEKCGGDVPKPPREPLSGELIFAIASALRAGWKQFAEAHGGSCACKPCGAAREFDRFILTQQG